MRLAACAVRRTPRRRARAGRRSAGVARDGAWRARCVGSGHDPSGSTSPGAVRVRLRRLGRPGRLAGRLLRTASPAAGGAVVGRSRGGGGARRGHLPGARPPGSPARRGHPGAGRAVVSRRPGAVGVAGGGARPPRAGRRAPGDPADPGSGRRTRAAPGAPGGRRRASGRAARPRGLACPTLVRFGDGGFPVEAARVEAAAQSRRGALPFRTPWRWRREHRREAP